MPTNPNLGPLVPIIGWVGSSSFAPGTTPFGIYDLDNQFTQSADQVGKWIANTLGYPFVSVELSSGSIYTNFEMATMRFGAIVNEFLIRENLTSYQGMPTGSTFTQKLIRTTPIPFIVNLAADYGSEVESGGTIDLKRGYITLHNTEQDYDLQSLWAAVSESGNRLEIRRIFHERVPAMQRFFDPFAGTGTDMSSLLGTFGWTGFAVASNFLIMPIYETLLRAQAIEINDQIRRSGFSFEIRNNKIRVYPVPDIDDEGTFMWFEYYVKADKFAMYAPSGSGGEGRAQQGVVSDFSNVPFAFIPFTDINDVGRQWIYQYTLGLCKITLGTIRSKYENIPIPNATIQLDGTSLRDEGEEMCRDLEDKLRESLEEAGRSSQFQKEQENAEAMENILRRVPLPIYIF